MNSLNLQIHFTASARGKALVALIMGLYLGFIVVVLQPFDTSQFKDENKTILMCGYGILMSISMLLYSLLENLIYVRNGKVWKVRDEVLSMVLFCLISGSVLYVYNRRVVNLIDLELETYWRFLRVTVLYMLPVFVPPLVYLRQNFGEKIVPPHENSMTLTGENKNEILSMEKDDLLFVKAVENYVEICFTDADGKVVSKTFRQTLSNVHAQLPFLEKCHRSYLVNPKKIKEIDGNSAGANIVFAVGDKEIPLSKTYYKPIKNSIGS